MAKPKGSPKTGGRVAGTQNKATMLAREAIGAFVDKNTPLLEELLEEIRVKHGPLAAYNCITDLIEYHVPKLQRSEVKHSGQIDSEIKVTATDQDLIARALEKLGEKSERNN